MIRQIGRGGMGAIFEGEHLRLPGKRYAIKVLRDVPSPAALQRFHREAQITSELGHDHIIEVHDFNVHDTGMPYLVMELLDGEDLSQRIRRVAPMPLDQVVRIVRQVALGLDAAHREGVVHRDLTPKNIFLCRRQGVDDFVKILDFGVSKCREMSAITRDNTVFGTPNYMSPEQAEGHALDVDECTDIFALGVVTWEMLTGTRAFDATTTTGAVYQVTNLEPTPVAQLRPDVPEAVDLVLATAMAKSKVQRYPSVLMFADELVLAAERADPSKRASAVPREASEAPDTVPVFVPLLHARKKRILFVDDSPSMCALVKAWLDQSGYVAAVATDGFDGAAKVAELRPDLVIADVNMPRCDGFQLCRTIKQSETTRHTPVILYTRLDEAADIVNGLAAGADAFVIKGSGARDLLRQVEYLLPDVANPLRRKTAAIAKLRGHDGSHGKSGIFKRLFDAMFREVPFDVLALLVERIEPRPLCLLGSHYRLSSAVTDALTAELVASYQRTTGRALAANSLDVEHVVIDETAAWSDGQVDLRRSVYVPILDGGDVNGCLGVYSFEDHPGLDANIRFFCDIGIAAATALRGSRPEE